MKFHLFGFMILFWLLLIWLVSFSFIYLLICFDSSLPFSLYILPPLLLKCGQGCVGPQQRASKVSLSCKQFTLISLTFISFFFFIQTRLFFSFFLSFWNNFYCFFFFWNHCYHYYYYSFLSFSFSFFFWNLIFGGENWKKERKKRKRLVVVLSLCLSGFYVYLFFIVSDTFLLRFPLCFVGYLFFSLLYSAVDREC